MNNFYFFRRCMSAALLLLACSIFLPSKTHAEDRVYLMVAGVRVTDKNAGNIVAPAGSDVTIEGVTYDPSTNTLLLKDANIVTHEYGLDAIATNGHGLNIKLVGESHITCDYVCINGSNFLNFTNGHVNKSQHPILHITTTDAYDYLFAAIELNRQPDCEEESCRLTINACDLDVQGHGAAIKGWYNPGPGETIEPHTINLDLENNATLRARTTSPVSTDGVFKYVKGMNEEALYFMHVMGYSNVGYDFDRMAFINNGTNQPVYPKEVRFAAPIAFEDNAVRDICVQNWDDNHDGFLDRVEARLVTSLEGKFTENTNITRFNELMYFTGLGILEDNAFNKSRNLQQVEMPYNLKIIGGEAFRGISNLTIVTIPRGVEAIEAFAFNGCTNLANVVFEDNSQLKSIGWLSFGSCPIEYLYLPDKLETIGEQAFWDNRLSQLTIPASVTEIKHNAFSQANLLPAKWSKIVFNGYTPPTVEENAFGPTEDNIWGTLVNSGLIIYAKQYRLNAYKTAIPQYAPYMVERKSYGVFICGEELAEDNLSADGYFIFSKGNNFASGIYYNYGTNTLTLKDATIRSRSATQPAITANGGGINIKLEGASIIDSSYKGISMSGAIYFSAFDVNYNEQPSVNIFAQKECIEYDNSNFGSWASIEFQNVSVYLGSAEGPCINGGPYDDSFDEELGYYFQAGDKASVTVENCSFVADCAMRTEIVKNVPLFYLKDCSILRPAEGISYNGEPIQGTLTWTPIPVYHFFYIGNWIEFEDPLVESICVNNWDQTGDGHLDYLEASSIYSIGTVFKGTDIQYFNELRYFMALEEIEDEAFMNCQELQYISYPGTTNFWRIGNSAFENCYMTMWPAHNIPETVTEIGDYAFKGTLMENVFIPASVRTIGKEAFTGCMGVYFSDNAQLETIGDRAFNGMSSWMYVDIPASVVTIGEEAFENCGGVFFAEDAKLETIGARAFFGISDPLSMLPASVKSIGAQAFDNATDENFSLWLEVKGYNPATIGVSAFGDGDLLLGDSRIFVPAGTASIYKQAWPEYADFIVSDDGPTAIKNVKAENSKRRGVFTLDGRMVRSNADINGLPAGLYIVNGKKVSVK